MQNTQPEIDSAGPESRSCLIPFKLGSELVLRSISNPALRAKTSFYGTVPGEMIIIEEPPFSIEERTGGCSEGFVCAYMDGTHLFKFKSKFSKHLFKNVIGIEYPNEIERIQIRSSTRIAVSIRTEVIIGAKHETLPASMEDISEGGCRLVLPEIIHTKRGSKLNLIFMLPDEQKVENVACEIMNIKHLYDAEATKVGVRFSDPTDAIMKIEKFCKLITCYSKRC